MKFFIMLVLAFAFTAFGAIENVGRSASLKFDKSVQNPEKEFINVKNVEGSTISAGMIVVLDLTEDDGASVIIDTTGTRHPLCIMVKDCSDDALCKCQTYGIFDSALVTVANGNASAGAPFYIATTTAGYISGVAGTGSQVAGEFYDASSASGAIQVFINTK